MNSGDGFALPKRHFFQPQDGLSVQNVLVQRLSQPMQALDDLNLLMMTLGRDVVFQPKRIESAETLFSSIHAARASLFKALKDKTSPAAFSFHQAKCDFVDLVTREVVAGAGLNANLPQDHLHSRLEELMTPVEGVDNPLRLSARNNHQVLRALTLLALGRHLKERSALKLSADIVAVYLTQVTPEGVPEPEAVRGASAGWYISTVLNMMTAYARLGAVNEVFSQGGLQEETLWSAISSISNLLDKSVGDPATLYSYSRRNMYPHPLHSGNPLEIDFRFLQGYHSGRNHLVWLALMENRIGPSDLPNIRTECMRVTDVLPRCNDFIGGYLDTVFGISDGRYLALSQETS